MTSEEAVPSQPVSNQQSIPWNVNTWAAAFQEAMANATIVKTKETTKEEPVYEMMGGWKFEGKEKPETPKICTRCQWVPKTDTKKEPDKEDWCEGCLISPGIGCIPPNWKPLDVQNQNLNKSFFG